MGVSKIVFGLAAAAVLASGVYGVAGGDKKLLRPPGAQSEDDFSARCIKCGKCIEACPYRSIVVAGLETGSAVGSPVINPRITACHLCEDFPCVQVCPTGALRDVSTRSDVRMGVAIIDEETCIAFKGLRCEVCYRVCPLIDEAITIDYRTNENDAIHAIFAPTIDKDVCTGCGLCVERCILDEPSVPIKIRPFDYESTVL